MNTGTIGVIMLWIMILFIILLGGLKIWQNIKMNNIVLAKNMKQFVNKVKKKPAKNYIEAEYKEAK